MLREVRVKSVLNKTRRRDPWFLDDYTVNPYSGCSFNCLYCYIRGSKYGTNMEEKLSVKINAPEVLERQLFNRAKKGERGVVVFGSATDPYLQVEKDTGLSRNLLKLFLKYRFPVHLITKSDLVLRDLDLLSEISRTAILPAELKQKNCAGAFITFSFSTLNEHDAALFEPGATRPARRLETMAECVKRGFTSGVSLMPLLPYITDTGENLHHMYSAFAGAGAKYTFAASLTLYGDEPADSRTLILRAVKKHYPHLLPRYLRFFEKSDYMPEYYLRALRNKTTELATAYGLRTKITG